MWNPCLLDYGCGNGNFLNSIFELRQDVALFGYDPESGHSSQRYHVTTHISDIEEASIDVFCSFETLEHLYCDERQDLYKESKRVLKNSGSVFISVPVIGGPTLLLKELNRMLLFKRRSEYQLKELVLALLGISAKRPDNPRPTHKGFNFREIEKEISSNFFIKVKMYSPFRMLPWHLNSQVFYICEKHQV